MSTQMVSDSEYERLKQDAQLASNNLTLAKREYDSKRKHLEGAVSKATKRHEANVAAAEEKLRQTQDELSGLIEEAGKIALYHDRLVVDDTVFHLLPDLTVEVSAGAVAKATSAQPTGNEHQVFFTASSSEGGKTLTVGASLEGQARDIASKVPSCIAQYPSLAESVAPRAEAARQELEQAKAATVEIESAQKELDDFVANDATVAEAQSAFDLANARLNDASGRNPSSIKKSACSARTLSIVFYVIAAVVVLIGMGTLVEYPSVGVVLFLAIVVFVLAYEAGLRGEKARKVLSAVSSFQDGQTDAVTPPGQDAAE